MAKYSLLTLTITPDHTVKELERWFPGSERLVMDLLHKISADLQHDAHAAFQTKVPFYSGELRNAQILDEPRRLRTKSGFCIYVASTKHRNTPGRRKPTGADLADLLDNGINERTGLPMMRRKNAVPALGKLTSLIAPAKGTPPKGWIDSAVASFEKALDTLG